MIRCIVFDFDGTLVDSNEIKHTSYFKVIKKCGGDISILQSILESSTGDRFSIFEEFILKSKNFGLLNHANNNQNEINRLVSEYSEFCEHAVINCATVAGAQEFLEHAYSKSLKLAVNSQTPVSSLNRIIKARGWSHFFTMVLGSEADKYTNLLHIHDETKVHRDEILMIGDKKVDMDASNKFNCMFIGVYNNQNNFDNQPKILIKNLCELISLIQC